METSPVTCRTLEDFCHIDGHTFGKQYKEVPSGYRDWDQLEHADRWLLFADNTGPHLAIDESLLSNGELYAFVTNRDACTRERSLVAVVAGTKPEDVIAVLSGEDYIPFRYPNGDTRKELLIRSRHLLFKYADKWTERQKQRAGILFGEYPDYRMPADFATPCV